MIIARFNCPACETPIEAPANSIARGVKCPQCETGFVPGRVQTSDEAVDPSLPNGQEMKVGPTDNIPRIYPSRPPTDINETKEEDQERGRQIRLSAALENRAEILSMAATGLAGVGLLIIVLSFVGSDLAGVPSGVLFVAGGFFSAAITLFFFAQLFHLRAGLAKLFTKE